MDLNLSSSNRSGEGQQILKGVERPLHQEANESRFAGSEGSVQNTHTDDDKLAAFASELESCRKQSKNVINAAKDPVLLQARYLPEMKDAFNEAEKTYKQFRRQRNEELSNSEQEKLLRQALNAYERLPDLLDAWGEENRACWLDRSDIIQGPKRLKERINELKEAGIDTIYFEADNGGWATYKSKLLKLNPDLEKWPAFDPMKDAIEHCHKNGIKVQAWVRVFSVCNRALDEKFRQAYPERHFPDNGPVLSQHESPSPDDPDNDWALRMENGSLPQNTHDLFLDPANPKASAFAQSVMLELASKYPELDGIQYDYIRYPFQNEKMGLNSNNWQRFQSEFPDYKNKTMPQTFESMDNSLKYKWNTFKVGRIDNFVMDTSTKLKAINPKLEISAAVFPLDYNERLRQDWLKWAKDGYIETINPMTYVPHEAKSKDAEFSREFERKFRFDLKEITRSMNEHGHDRHSLDKHGRDRHGHNRINDRYAATSAEILPGIAVSRVNPMGLQKELDIVKEMSFPGETLFASSVLDKRRLADLALRDAGIELHKFMLLSKACLKASKGERGIVSTIWMQSAQRHLKKSSDYLATYIKAGR